MVSQKALTPTNRGRRVFKRALMLFALMFSFSSQIANAAFCSLRDPVSAIAHFYPDNSHYRSLLAPITETTRQTVQQRIPFTLHRSEIGKHTLYLVLNNQTPQGIVQARSEITEWGIIELAWSISMDMKIKGLYFQRCRSPQCSPELAAEISQILQGKSISELKFLLSKDGKTLSPEFSTKIAEKNILLLSIQSAMKTLSVTEIAWESQLKQLGVINSLSEQSQR